MSTSHRFFAAITALLFAAAISGCSSSEPPKPNVYVYPAQGQTPQQQAQDTSECQTWAQQQSGYSPGTDTAKGVGVGAAHRRVRASVPHLDADRPPAPDIATVRELLRAGTLLVDV